MAWYVKGTSNGVTVYYAGEKPVFTWVPVGSPEESKKVAFSSKSDAENTLSELESTLKQAYSPGVFDNPTMDKNSVTIVEE